MLDSHILERFATDREPGVSGCSRNPTFENAPGRDSGRPLAFRARVTAAGQRDADFPRAMFDEFVSASLRFTRDAVAGPRARTCRGASPLQR